MIFEVNLKEKAKILPFWRKRDEGGEEEEAASEQDLLFQVWERWIQR